MSCKYRVFFTDKKDVVFNPYEYFDAKAIERRVRLGIPLSDSSDYPVNESYVHSVAAVVDSLSYQSRWLNEVTVFSTPSAMVAVAALPFVKKIEYAEGYAAVCSVTGVQKKLSAADSALLEFQTERMQGSLFREKNINGKGIRIAVFDAGFPGVNTSRVFEHIRKEGRIIKTFDFVTGKDFVYHANAHGTAVFSCIGGMDASRCTGLATGSEYLLARTENILTETLSEEENWLAAAEWADKNGAQIINSSLGYTYKRYFNTEMDGKKSLAARAAGIAAAKGILVISAAGNDGDNIWHNIATPADADSTLAVGGTDPYTDLHAGFSSFGPSSDGRIKPNVSAPGIAAAASPSGLIVLQGTSVSAPLVTGFAACAWQAGNTNNNMDLLRDIEKSGHLYPYFDYAHGYGIPQASFFTGPHSEPVPTFGFETNEVSVRIVLKEDPLPLAGKKHLYYHIEDAEGKLKHYTAVYAEQREVFSIPLSRYSKGSLLVVHYEGYTSSYRF